jgi:hypothetical protein
MNTVFHTAHSNNYGNLMVAKLVKSLKPTAGTCSVTATTPTFLKGVKNQQVKMSVAADYDVASANGQFIIKFYMARTSDNDLGGA